MYFATVVWPTSSAKNWSRLIYASFSEAVNHATTFVPTFMGPDPSLIRDMSLANPLGCSSHPWRAPQSRHQCRPNLSREVHDQAKTPSVTRVENVPSQHI